MNNLSYVRIQNKDINTYLDTRNLKINRQFSNSKKKIDRLNHYIWWFSNNNRTSYLVKKIIKHFNFDRRQENYKRKVIY